MHKPAVSPASKIAVPVADNRFTLNSAFSGFVPTGAIRCTTLCKFGTWNLVEVRSRTALNRGDPHARMNNVSSSHGSHALNNIPETGAVFARSEERRVGKECRS